jgi:hypothetical protein
MPWTTNEQWGVIFCDIQKAFNCVNHYILLSKTRVYITTGKEKTSHKHYLNRYQTASINSKKYNSTIFSKWFTIEHSVQQGSILGPLLFVIYK